MMEYKCIKDRQGGNFAIGRCGNLDYWRETASAWAESDDNDDLQKLVNKVNDEKLIGTIDEIWDIEIIQA